MKDQGRDKKSRTEGEWLSGTWHLSSMGKAVKKGKKGSDRCADIGSRLDSACNKK